MIPVRKSDNAEVHKIESENISSPKHYPSDLIAPLNSLNTVM